MRAHCQVPAGSGAADELLHSGVQLTRHVLTGTSIDARMSSGSMRPLGTGALGESSSSSVGAYETRFRFMRTCASALLLGTELQ